MYIYIYVDSASIVDCCKVCNDEQIIRPQFHRYLHIYICMYIYKTEFVKV